MKRLPDIVCLAPDYWSGLWRRRHQLMTRLAHEHRVLFVEPPTSALTPLRSPNRRSAWRQAMLGLRQVLPNLFVCPLINPLPLVRLHRVRRVARRILARQLSRAMGELRITQPIVWLCFRRGWPVTFLDLLHPSLVCYDCHDKYTGYATVAEAEGRTIEAWEKEVLRCADIVLAVSSPLKAHLEAFHHDVHVVPNGVDYTRYSKPSPAIPNDLAGLRSPVVGYVGYVSHKIDFSLLGVLSSDRPDWSFVIVGPQDIQIDHTEYEHFKSRANVRFLGYKPIEVLPSYLGHMDVCLMPFKENSQIRHSSPNKYYEYLAAGRPVVSVPIDDLAPVSGAVYVAQGAKDFETAIERALLEDSAEAVLLRQAEARKHTWDSRVEQVEQLLADALARKRS